MESCEEKEDCLKILNFYMPISSEADLSFGDVFFNEEVGDPDPDPGPDSGEEDSRESSLNSTAKL